MRAGRMAQQLKLLPLEVSFQAEGSEGPIRVAGYYFSNIS
jgi:hypothetical protein